MRSGACVPRVSGEEVARHVDVCARCGHELGIGRFCTNCGLPVGAEPAAVPAPPSRHRHVDESRRHRAAAGRVAWVAGLAAMLLVATVGLWWLLADREDLTAATEPAGEAEQTQRPARDPRTPQGRATVSSAPEAVPGDLAATVTVRAPRSAPTTQDVTGSPVRFVAAHLLDGVPETCWRMPGDGTGETITFDLGRPTEMTEVGLVNGYAKTASNAAGTYDWYAGNRRTLRVEWGFDDGTVLTQDLRQTRRMQTVRLEQGVVTGQVTLALVEVSPPGAGPASRDYTPISEVALRGAPV